MPSRNNKKVIKDSISAAKTALTDIETGKPITKDTLKLMSKAIGEPRDQYDNYTGGLLPQSESQRRTAMEYLQDFIHDRNIELRSRYARQNRRRNKQSPE